MANSKRSDIIDQLVGSYLKIPVSIFWESASGLPFPDRFSGAQLELQGIATEWLNLKQIIWRADEIRFEPGLPARLHLSGPSVEISVGQEALDTWMSRFELPYRLELAEDGLIVHTEIAGFPIAEFETRLEVAGGWFVLQPKRASFLGMPAYVSSIFRSYLPLPPLSKESRLAGIEHGKGLIRVRFELDDFEEEVTPGLLMRLRKRYFPIVDQLSGILGNR